MFGSLLIKTPVHLDEEVENTHLVKRPLVISELSYLMSAFGYSSIVGYASHLPLKHVSLPLKYLKEEISADSAERFTNNIFSFGGFIDLSSQKGHFFCSIQYGIDNDRKTIHLIPILADEVTSLSVQFQRIQIHLPHPVIGKGMAVFHFVSLTTDEEPYLVIDIIDESYLLINLKIELSDFLVGNLNNRLVLDSFSEWVNISVPYSFELRSLPFFMEALDAHNIIVSLKDGGLLHFSRPSVLSSVDIFNFSEAYTFLSLTLGSIFRNNKSDRVVDGISSNAIVDVVKVSEFQFVTLSARKCLIIWDMRSHKQVSSTIELGKFHTSSSWLTTVPTKYMQVHEIESSRYLSVVYTAEDDSEVTSGFVFQSYRILPEGLIPDSEEYKFSPEQPSTSSTTESNVFKIQDFQIPSSLESSTVNYFVLWKSNTYSVLARYDVNIASSAITQVSFSIPHSSLLSDELILRQGDSYYQNMIFNSGHYDKDIVSTALSIFKSKSGRTSGDLSGMSLTQEVRFTITNTSKAIGVSTTALWYKLYLICEEFRKLCKESLSLLVRPNFVLTCEAKGVGVYREAHNYESFGRRDTTGDFAKLLQGLSSKFSANTKRKLVEEIKALSRITASDASRLASSYLSSKITGEEVSKIMDEMKNIPFAVKVIDEVINSDFRDEIALDEHSAVRSGTGYGLFSKLLTVSTFKHIKDSHQSTLLNLFILFLLCEVNETILNFLSAIVQRFSRYAMFEDVFDICFTGSSSKCGIEESNVSLLENSIFWTAAVNKYPELLCLIKSKNYNAAFDYYSKIVLGTHHEELLLNVILDLLNRNEAKTVKEKFTSTFEINSPLNRFLSGLLSLANNDPSQFFVMMSDYDTFKAIGDEDTKNLLINGLSSNQELKSFLSSIFAKSMDDVLTRANYFHELAKLSKAFSKKSVTVMDDSTSSKNFMEKSLEFEQRAVKILEETGTSSGDVVGFKTILLRNLFEESLELFDFSGAINSLHKLSLLVSKSDLKSYFTRLMRILITRREISRCFSASKNSLFVENYLLVDNILLELANNDLILSNALRCYEFLYSWRLFGSSTGFRSLNLGDKRGAVEALYIFITRFRLEQENLGLSSNESEDFKQFKLKVLELYMIIINCLKTFNDAEDRWFVKRDNSQRLGVIDLSELTLEYFKWLKELEKELDDVIQ